MLAAQTGDAADSLFLVSSFGSRSFVRKTGMARWSGKYLQTRRANVPSARSETLASESATALMIGSSDARGSRIQTTLSLRYALLNSRAIFVIALKRTAALASFRY